MRYRSLLWFVIGLLISFALFSASYGKDFVRVSSYGKGVNRSFVDRAVSRLNQVYANGCLEKEVLSYPFKTRTTASGKALGSNTEVWDALTKNAPHAIQIRWYSKRFSKVIGYTYTNSDTIWSNTRMMGVVDDYGSHLAHETSHQGRAGGFVHWTVFAGSVPYAFGDIAAKCLKRL